MRILVICGDRLSAPSPEGIAPAWVRALQSDPRIAQAQRVVNVAEAHLDEEGVAGGVLDALCALKDRGWSETQLRFLVQWPDLHPSDGEASSRLKARRWARSMLLVQGVLSARRVPVAMLCRADPCSRQVGIESRESRMLSLVEGRRILALPELWDHPSEAEARRMVTGELVPWLVERAFSATPFLTPIARATAR